MAGIQDKAVVDALGTLSDNLLLVIKQLKDGENTRDHDQDFDAMSFWGRFGLTFKAVSAEATKLAMAFSSHPTPDARGTETLAGGVEKSALAMLSAFYSLPETQGRTLHHHTLSTVLCILNSVQSLVDVIKTEGVEGSKRQFQSTGSVWEYCDSFPSLPKNNKDAVVKEAREHSDLVKDALEEIESAINEDEDDDYEAEAGEDRWSDADHALLNPALGLIKAARSSAKKSMLAIRDNAKCVDEASVAELDALAAVMARVSPAVDDFVLSLYPPLKDDIVREEGQKLTDVLLCLLSKLKNSHAAAKADSKWIDFLSKAVTHNHDKMIELLPE